MSLPLALQLYSVREQAAADLRGVLEEVASWGYDGVEFAGLYENDPKEVRGWLDEFGLKCEGAHLSVDRMTGDALGPTLDELGTLGGKYAIVPWLPAERRNTLEAAERTAAWFGELTDAVEARGLRTGFHCHHEDMHGLVPDGGVESSAWYVIARNTPASFVMQYDTGNGMGGGAEAAQPLRDFPGRAASLHLKTFVKGDGDGQGKAAIGADDVPWKDVLDAARDVGGTEWLVVEQEGHPTLGPMAAAKASLDGLAAFV